MHTPIKSNDLINSLISLMKKRFLPLSILFTSLNSNLFVRAKYQKKSHANRAILIYDNM